LLRQAERVLGCLGLDHHLNEIHDIAAAEFLAKPLSRATAS
jgi:hypothetical protein